jgi:hypothetical protein
MDFSDTVMAAVLGFAISWWITGLVIVAFASPIFIYPGAPWAYRLLAVAKAAWGTPWLIITTGMPPMITLAPANDPEAEKAVDAWVEQYRKTKCRCPSCRARRGE